eukprot:TRINITY_DN4397_c0_g2_i2.p1 TRINITY_DN4397_c0_g2~~TRINITY_DN4397_c0_g2_i2.p1  ORF type:complete len:710 (-),score=91.30 TRINITY_DN4397_c0_g2_i2:190-2319(-)
MYFDTYKGVQQNWCVDCFGSTPSLQEGHQLQFSGYGYTSLVDKEEYSVQTLREAKVKYVSESTCKVLLGFYGGGVDLSGLLDYDVMGCAYNPRADSCGGDYGGPIVIKGALASQDILVGLLSWGPALQCRSQEDSQAPVVFTNVHSLLPWIRNITQDIQNAPCSKDDCMSIKPTLPNEDFQQCLNVDCDFEVDGNSHFSYLVALMIKSSEEDEEDCYQYVCDGVVVGQSSIVTSAKCVAAFLSDNRIGMQEVELQETLFYVASLGDCNENQEMGGIVEVKEIEFHPSFDVKDGQDSLALLSLMEDLVDATPLEYKKSIYIDAEVTGQVHIVSSSYEQISSNETRLQKVEELQLDTVSENSCSVLLDMFYGSSNQQNRILNYDSSVCGLNAELGACGGKRGSPIVFKGEDLDKDILVGIASWGPGLECRNQEVKQSPVVFTRISNYVDWISSIVDKETRVNERAIIKRTFSLQNPEQGDQAPCNPGRKLLGMLGKDDREAVMSTFCYPFSAIGTIGNCTGSMISPLHVLTAGHCLLDIEDRTPLHANDTLQFVSGANGFQEKAVSKVLSYDVPHQLLDSLDFTFDIAIVTLANPIGFETGWLGIVPQSFTASGSKVNLVGYPLDLGLQLPYTTKCILNIQKGSKNQTRHTCDTTRGMGGAPLFVVNSQKRSDAFIMAIHTLFEKTTVENHAALMTEALIQFVQQYVDNDI